MNQGTKALRIAVNGGGSISMIPAQLGMDGMATPPRAPWSWAEENRPSSREASITSGAPVNTQWPP